MKLVWDAIGTRTYETGTKRGVLFKANNIGGYESGVAWSGLTSVSENPSGGEANDNYADDIKYLSLMSSEELGLSIEAYTYPKEFEECDGTSTIINGVTIGQQTRKNFAFAYTTIEGNDTQGNDYNEKIHLIYGCKASPSEKGYQTISDSPEPITFSWDVTTTPVAVTIGGVEYKPTAKVEISKRTVGSEAYAAICNKLYGTETEESTLLMPSQIYSIISEINGDEPEPTPTPTPTEVEGYYYNGKFYSDEEHETEITGVNDGTIYIDITDGGSDRYIFNGQAFVAAE